MSSYFSYSSSCKWVWLSFLLLKLLLPQQYNLWYMCSFQLSPIHYKWHFSGLYILYFYVYSIWENTFRLAFTTHRWQTRTLLWLISRKRIQLQLWWVVCVKVVCVSAFMCWCWFKTIVWEMWFKILVWEILFAFHIVSNFKTSILIITSQWHFHTTYKHTTSWCNDAWFHRYHGLNLQSE